MHRAVDHGKDQSYVLGVLTQDQLRHSLFPLGGSPKPSVRAEAAARGLLVADKPDSHDICFVADGDNAGWLREKLGDRAPNHGGPIVDESTGEELGRHEGTYALHDRPAQGAAASARPAPDGRPRFVLDIEPVSGTVLVGPRERLAVDGLSAIRPRWCGTGARAGRGHRPAARPRRRAPRGRLRRRATDVVEVELLDPAYGIAPGPGGRRLRRHAGRRVGHHLGDAVAP